MANESDSAPKPRDLTSLDRMAWLADVPLFIDEDRVGRFFDAVVRPKYEVTKVVREASQEAIKKVTTTLSGDAKISAKLPAYLSFITDTGAEAQIAAEHVRNNEATNKSAEASELLVIESAERKLEELAVFYLLHHADRIVTNEGILGQKERKLWYQAPFTELQDIPRAIGFLDFPPETILIPTAAEFQSGEVVRLYELLLKELTGEKGGPMAAYPRDGSESSESALREKRKAYWASFANWVKHDSRAAMRVIESAAQTRGRITWIDFRLPLNDEGDTLHLHFAPNGKYSTGDFGYYLTTRCYKHGLRIVGTLKSEPDMNVLAVYEK